MQSVQRQAQQASLPLWSLTYSRHFLYLSSILSCSKFLPLHPTKTPHPIIASSTIPLLGPSGPYAKLFNSPKISSTPLQSLPFNASWRNDFYFLSKFGGRRLFACATPIVKASFLVGLRRAASRWAYGQPWLSKNRSKRMYT